jgi:hypothetical protein
MVRISYIKSIKLFYDMIKYYHYQDTFDITSFKDLKTTWVYERKTDTINNTTFPEFVVNFGWYQFGAWVDELFEGEPGPANVWISVSRMYSKEFKMLSASYIQKAWRKYRLRTSRLRNDLAIHGLAEYWGHPSRITFNID